MTQEELKRRTKGRDAFPNGSTLLRLVSAVPLEVSEEWKTGRKYLSMKQELHPAVSAFYRSEVALSWDLRVSSSPRSRLCQASHPVPRIPWRSRILMVMETKTLWGCW